MQAEQGPRRSTGGIRKGISNLIQKAKRRFSKAEAFPEPSEDELRHIEREAGTLTLAIVGEEGSGRRTMLKNIAFSILKKHLPQDEARLLKARIHYMIISQFQILLENADQEGFQFHDDEYEYQRLAADVDSLNPNLPIHADDMEKLCKLWFHPLFCGTYEERPSGIHHSLEHFANKLPIMAEKGEDWLPNVEDALRCPVVRTLDGVLAQRFSWKGNEFKAVTVVNKWDARSKWLQQLAEVSMILYFVALPSRQRRTDAIDENLVRKEYKEALDHFAAICNSKVLIDTPIMLVFTHADVFLDMEQGYGDFEMRLQQLHQFFNEEARTRDVSSIFIDTTNLVHAETLMRRVGMELIRSAEMMENGNTFEKGPSDRSGRQDGQDGEANVSEAANPL
eukprot:g2816.t1